jgi:serine protease Do
MKKIFSIIFITFLGFQTSIANGSNIYRDGFSSIVEPLMPAVVNIYTKQHIKQEKRGPSGQIENDPFYRFFEQFDFPFGFEEFYQNPNSGALGSGFIIDADGYIVTNHHLVKGADEINVKLNDNTELEAKLIGSDTKTDLALLKVEAKKPLPFVEFGDASKSKVGDWVIAIGNPFGLGGTVTTGIISSKGRDINADGSGLVDNYIQTDAAINMGNSGGPMFDVNGKVIGVNTAIFSNSGSNIGIGFAIPANTVQHVISDLKKHGKVSRGFLNIKIQEISPQIAEAMNLDTEEGVLVVEVDSKGAGHKAGLKPGDVIVKVGDAKIINSRKLQITIADSPIGSTVKLVVLRHGKTKELECKLTSSDKSLENDSEVNQTIGSSEAFKIKGIEFVNGIKGVMVKRITPDAKWRGLKPGDLIISVNQSPITNIKDFEEIHQNAVKNEKKHIVLFIKRHNSKVFVALPI